VGIQGLSEDDFKAVLRNNLTPAKAISNPAHLRGRQQLLTQISWAFNSPGKNVFIYGERGVGKTSLAQTAATLHQSSDAAPIQIACDEFVDFNKMIADIARRALPPRDVIEQADKKHRLSARIAGLSAELQEGIKRGVIPEITSLNDAVITLQYVSELHSREPVVIVDEFDQVASNEDKKRFADLIKQVSDQEIGMRFIFCGIGASLEELIGVHLSTDRYIAPVAVEPLSHDALWEILNTTSAELGVTVGHEENVRISRISDGFPYYTHLIGEHMFRSMFYDDEDADTVKLKHFGEGMRGAVSEAMGSLKQVYEVAVQKRANGYEEVLWSVADDTLFSRKSSDIFVKSYVPIMDSLNRGKPDQERRSVLSQTVFYQRMNALKRDSHGAILEGTKQGWYKFRENWMRGYVRLMAEKAGVPLGVDHHLASKPAHRAQK